MDEKAIEARGYAKGYSAGKRRSWVGASRELRDAYQEDFIQQMMIAVAPQIIAAPWGRKVNGEWKSDTGVKEIMATVRGIAEEAANRCFFHHASAIEARRAATTGAVHESAVAKPDAQGASS